LFEGVVGADRVRGWVIEADEGADIGVFDLSFGGKSACPGNVAMGVGVESVRALGEKPFGAGEMFAEREEVGGDIGMGTGEALFAHGKLVHEREAEDVFFAGEIDGAKFAGEKASHFPADLATETGFIAAGLEVGKLAQENGEDGADEMPILSAAGKERREFEGAALEFVEVDDGEIAAARGSDVEAETITGAFLFRESLVEGVDDELADVAFAVELELDPELAEEIEHFGFFEVEAFDFGVDHAALDGGPGDDAVGSTGGVAHVFLFEDFREAGAFLAVGDELFASEAGAADLVDLLDEAGFDGVLKRDSVVTPHGLRVWGGRFLSRSATEATCSAKAFLSRSATEATGRVRVVVSRSATGTTRGATEAAGGFAAEGVEEGIGAVVRGPDGEVETPGDAATGCSPEAFLIGVKGEFVEADIASVSAKSIGIRAKGEDARAVIELDIADLEILGKPGVFAVFEHRHFPGIDAMGEDGFGVIEDFAELIAGGDVFDGGGLVFGGKEVVAPGIEQAFADVFESVGEGPADAN